MTRTEWGLYHLKEPIEARSQKIDNSTIGWRWVIRPLIDPGIYRGAIMSSGSGKFMHLIDDDGNIIGTWDIGSLEHEKLLSVIERWGKLPGPPRSKDPPLYGALSNHRTDGRQLFAT
jgi:hypothetical protein